MKVANGASQCQECLAGSPWGVGPARWHCQGCGAGLGASPAVSSQAQALLLILDLLDPPALPGSAHVRILRQPWGRASVPVSCRGDSGVPCPRGGCRRGGSADPSLIPCWGTGSQGEHPCPCRGTGDTHSCAQVAFGDAAAPGLLGEAPEGGDTP